MAIVSPAGSRWLERLLLLFVSVVIGLLFYRLYAVMQTDFAHVDQRLANGTMMNLNGPEPRQHIRQLLQKGYYFSDLKDIELVGSAVEKGLHLQQEPVDNIGELNKRTYHVPAKEAYSRGGNRFKKRVEVERALLGFSGADSNLFVQELNYPATLPTQNNLALGSLSISGTISDAGQPASGVLVRLQMILPRDSLYNGVLAENPEEIIKQKNGVRRVFVVDTAGGLQLQSLAAFARTGPDGSFAFTGLPAGKAFEVLPLQPGAQFGRTKGVSNLVSSQNLHFSRVPHTLRLFSSRDFNTLKKEGALIVRTPQEASKWFMIIAGGFIAGFWLLHLLLSIRFPAADQLIIPVLMILTGLSLLTLFSLQDSLRDRFLAQSTFFYFLGGWVGIILMLLFNLRYFTTDSAFFRLFIFKNTHSARNGWPWALLAIGLLTLTIVWGSGPEGSGVKVNLFGFQPSELVKLLVVIFLAGYFAANEQFIAEYTRYLRRWSFFAFALAAIITTILLFLILGDLGPAMVCCFTFIVLFSFSRGDFSLMIGAIVIYVMLMWLLKNVWLATGITVGAGIIYMLMAKKQLAESVVMSLVVLAGFMLLDKIPFLFQLFPGPLQRLIDRKAIWQNPWDNEVFGGDHVANSIWAITGGGFSGQGIGEGFAKTIPEAHTDMILPAIGEEFGLAGVLSIFILFVIYLHRSIIVGRQTGTPFLFYLCAGIGISTFIQFLLIAGGSVGALPLSGVAMPFISYGGSSLILNMLAAGFLLSASVLRGSPAQMKYISTRHDKNLVPALVAGFAGILLLSVTVSRYVFNNQYWVVQPSLVADRSGGRMFSYNPRIHILMNRLQAGNLLDRKGRILATSTPGHIYQQLDSLIAAGVEKKEVDAMAFKRQDRYYPFAGQMFFWTGDANTGVFMGATNGYFGEYEHASALRGFPTPVTKYQVSAHRYRENRFLPQTDIEMTVSKRDYSALADLLLAGINSQQVAAFKQRNRNVQLSVDAALQTRIQQSVASDDSLVNKRVSVVVMQSNTGDVLASAAYPLAPVDNWEMLNLSVSEQNSLPYFVTLSDIGFTHATQPGSTAKLATALAGFNKMGIALASKSILIHPWDLIRVSGYEPDEAGYIGVERAIVRSNNAYFIRLANEEQLQEEMGTIYLKTGMFLHGVGGYYYRYDTNNAAQEEEWRKLWRTTEFASLKQYNPGNIRRTRGKGISGMSWGQGELIATPAAVARMAAAIANNGRLMPNRFVVNVSGTNTPAGKPVLLANRPEYARLMTTYMLKQSANKSQRLGAVVAGKTGTPERIFKNRRINDGWYVFFAPSANHSGHIVTCVRIEDARGSSQAVKLAGDHVIPHLLKLGLIKSFEETSP